MAINQYDSDNYLKLPQDKPLNDLSRLLFTTQKPDDTDRFHTVQFIRDDIKLTIKHFDELHRSASALKLLDLIVLFTVSDKEETVRIPLRQYMAIRARKHETDTRDQLKKDMKLLNSISFDFIKTGSKSWTTIGIGANYFGIENGVIFFRMTPEFFGSLPEQFMFMPIEYFRINDHTNPHATFLLRRLAEHKKLNLGKTNENTIRIQTLLDACPLLDTKTGKFKERILDPFERDMNSLSCIKWKYKNKPDKLKFRDFINLKIEVEWLNYPDTRKYIEKRRAASATKVIEMNEGKKIS